MGDPKDNDVEMQEDYDEEADSDFMSTGDASNEAASSSDEANEPDLNTRPRKRQKTEQKPTVQDVGDLDSGDEATIKEHKKTRRREKRKDETAGVDSGAESEGWRARTRAMRDREKEETKKNKIASIHSSTVDVEKLWEQMNSPAALHLSAPVQIQEDVDATADDLPTRDHANSSPSNNKENVPESEEDMVTIKRTYVFAGQTHTEEKAVPRSSAEARLWLSQQASKPQARDAEGRVVQRPLRKVSRFDPNLNSIDAFKGGWVALANGKKAPTGPKLNVVEKSKMDWAVHVDSEGLKEELDEHAKAKGGYLNRMDFLRDVEVRKEDEARAARLA